MCTYVSTHMLWFVWGSQRTVYKIWLSLSTMQVSRIEIRLSGLVAGIFTY